MLNKFLMPLNCGLPDGSAAVTLTLKSTGGDMFQRTDCAEMRLFPMEVGWRPTGWAKMGRHRICIEQRPEVEWLPLDARSYLLRFQYPPEIRPHFIDTFRAGVGKDKRLKQIEEGAQPDLESFWDDGFIHMGFGNLVCAKFEVQNRPSPMSFGRAIRRCAQSLTVQCWSSISTNWDFADFIASIKARKPAPESRTDFAEIVNPGNLRVQIQLKPRGWPAERTKLSPGAKAFTVSISLPKAGDATTHYRQESKTWQRLVEAVDELSGDFTEL